VAAVDAEGFIKNVADLEWAQAKGCRGAHCELHFAVAHALIAALGVRSGWWAR